jgi:hypothetical protein
MAMRIWNWATIVINKMRTRRSHLGPWLAFKRMSIFFTKKLLMRFIKLNAIWILLKGACMWAMWCQRNDKIFVGKLWTDDMVIMHVWMAMLEYGCSAWNKILKNCTHFLMKAQSLLKRFDRSWMARRVFGRRSKLGV